MANLEVTIGADIKDLLRKLDLTENEFKKLAIEAAKSGKTVEQVLKNSGKGGTALQKSAESAASGMQSLNKSTVNATPSVLEFSRVIQDAPYGIQGVANNIQQLTGNFANLQKQAGGTVPALKAFAGSFLGPAGIVFAVSAVTSLLVTYGDELFGLIGTTDELTEATKEYLGEAKSEINTLNTLLAVARDETNSKDVRLRAIKQINDKYGEYLGNLDLESIKTDAVTKSVNKLTEALILEAKLKGAKDAIDKGIQARTGDLLAAENARAKAQAQLNKQINDAISSNSLLNTKLGKIRDQEKRTQAFLELTEAQGIFGEAARQAGVGVEIANGNLKDAESNLKSINSEIDNTIGRFVKLEKSLTEQLFEAQIGANVDKDAVIVTADLSELKAAENKRIKSAEQVKKALAEIEAELAEDSIENIEKITKANEFYAASLEKLQPVKEDAFLLNLNQSVREIERLEDKLKEVTAEFKKVGLEVNLSGLNVSQLDALSEKLRVTQEQTSILTGLIGQSFGNLSSTISNELQTGNALVDSFVSGIISSLTQLLAQSLATAIAQKAIGKLQIGTEQAKSSANAVTIASSAAAALGPAGVFALPGLIASQLALVNGTFAGIQAFAAGGFSGDRNLIRVNGNEAILTSRDQIELMNFMRNNKMPDTRFASVTDRDIASTDLRAIVRGDQLALILKRNQGRR